MRSLVRVSSPFRGEVGACHTTDSCPSHSQLSRPMPRGQHTSVEHGRPYQKQCLPCLAFRFTCLAFVHRHENIACMQTIWPVSDQTSEQCVTFIMCSARSALKCATKNKKKEGKKYIYNNMVLSTHVSKT